MSNRILLLAPLGLIMAVGFGCAADRHVFHSYVKRPTSVAVIDTATHETLWSIDIPVQHTLELDFDALADQSGLVVDRRPATKMDWAVYRSSVKKGATHGRNYPSTAAVDHGIVRLPGRPIRIALTIREAPEFPAGESPPSVVHAVEVPSTQPVKHPAGPTTGPETEVEDVVDQVEADDQVIQEVEAEIEEQVEEATELDEDLTK